MAKSKEQILELIDNLLVDITKQYEQLRNDDQLDKVGYVLLKGQVDYLSAHLQALTYIESISADAAGPENGASLQTVVAVEMDAQETFDEITEVPPVFVAEQVQVQEVTPIQERVAPTIETVVPDMESTPTSQEVDNKTLPVAPAASQPVVREVVVEEKVVQVPVSQPTVEVSAEASASRPLSINERIQQQKQAGMNNTQQFQTSATSERAIDLKSAVSLNDKLLFIKDLFNGYSLAYSEALEILNKYDSLAEADAFLQTNYALKNGWADKPQTVEKFYTLLRKKFVN